MPTNMSVGVNLSLTGKQDRHGQWSIKAHYAQGTTVPESRKVVRSNGKINLGHMAMAGDLGPATDISFTIAAVEVTDRFGKPASVVFATPASAAIGFTPEAGNEFAHFEEGAGQQSLTFTDADDDRKDYEYRLTVTCFENGATTGVPYILDPPLVNRRDG
ncbi:hypothetical protein [Thermaurantiacus sp.]